VRDGLALLAILARVRRRLRALAAMEATVVAAAAVVATSAIAIAVMRWRGTAASLHTRQVEIAAAVAIVALGALAGALRRFPLARCARFIDRALDGSGARHDRVLSALAFTRLPDTAATPFMRAALADAIAHAQHVAPGAAAPLRRPRATPAFAAAAILLGVGAFSPMPARGSRAPLNPLASATASSKEAATRRLRLPGRALDPERDEVAAALRAAKELRDAQFTGIAQALAATVDDLSNRGLEPGEALDRLSDLLHRAEADADDLAGLPSALEQAGKALQGTSATRETGAALAAQDGAATQHALDALADRAAAAADEERNRIANTLDRASDRVRMLDDARRIDAPAQGMPEAGQPPSSGGSMAVGTNGSSSADDGASEPSKRRLGSDQSQASQQSSSSSGAAAPSAANERRLQRLQRELKQTASACRTNPEACRQGLKRQGSELPRMENEARSLSERQRLAEAIRQLRERLRREGGGAGERGREERRFLRSARGENARNHGAKQDDSESHGSGRAYAEDPDDTGGESDDMESEAGEGAGEGAPLASGEAEQSQGAAAEGNPGQGAPGQDSANGDGIGNQRGNQPLGERGSMVTRGHAREAQVKDGAGPTRSQVIQAAAQRGFAHTSYQNVFTDYQSVVEESLDGSAVPPGRRYIVRRYFQLIRPQSARAPQSSSPAPKR
jgi:hypothetical protein